MSFKRYIAIWSLLWAMGLCYGYHAAANESTNDDELLYEETCLLLWAVYQIECDDTPTPMVVYFSDEPKYRGYFIETQPTVVYVSSIIDDVQRRSTTVHEMVHYVLHAQGIVSLSTKNNFQRCLSEQISFTISNRYAFRRNEPQRIDWVSSYPHCYWYKVESSVVQ